MKAKPLSEGEMHDRMREIARDITSETFSLPRWEVGDIVEHPDGHPVVILSGVLWREYPDGAQRLENQWTWKKVDGAGQAYGEVQTGSGWATDHSVLSPSFGH